VINFIKPIIEHVCQVSISPTFYEQPFMHESVLYNSFVLTIWLCNFSLRDEIDSGVNLREAFDPESEKRLTT
jgi:hypothetical protein